MNKDRVVTTRITGEYGQILDALVSVTGTSAADILRRYIVTGLEADITPEGLEALRRQQDIEAQRNQDLIESLNRAKAFIAGNNPK